MAPKFYQLARLFCERSDHMWRDPQFLDSGGSAEVYEVVGLSARAALKVYDPTFFEGADGLAEIDRLRRQRDLVGLRHPNMVEILGVEAFTGEGTWTVLMEFVPPPNLEKGLGAVTSAMIRPLLKQLVAATRFLEERPRPLYHRDIKPANIGLDVAAISVKLLDLGVVRCPLPDEFVSDQPGTKRFLATVQYSSPEYLVRDGSWGDERDQLRALTFYQVGAVLHDLIMRRPIFADVVATKNKALLVEAVRNQLPKIGNPDVDPDLIELANACLTKDPRVRLQRVSWDSFDRVPSDPKVALADLLGRRSGLSEDSGANASHLQLQNVASEVFDVAVEALQQNGEAFGPFATQPHNKSRSRSMTFSLEAPPTTAEIHITVTVEPATGSGDSYEIFVEALLANAGYVPTAASGVPLSVVHGISVEDRSVLCSLLVDRFALLCRAAFARCDAYDGSPVAIQVEA